MVEVNEGVGKNGFGGDAHAGAIEVDTPFQDQFADAGFTESSWAACRAGAQLREQKIIKPWIWLLRDTRNELDFAEGHGESRCYT